MPVLTSHLIFSLCFVAGQSGGHILPCITQAEQIMQQNQSTQAYLLSSGSSLDMTIMKKHPSIKHIVPTEINSIPYKQPWKLPLFIYKISTYFFKTMYQLYHIKPKKIISYGGLVSIPVCIAGKLLGIPIELYELNVQPGKSIQFLSHFTDTIHICFQKTKNYFKDKTCKLVPYPIRFTQQDIQHDTSTLLTKYNLKHNKKTVLILGGSQGSIFINQAFLNALKKSTFKNSIQVIHQTGNQNCQNYKEWYKQQDIPAVVFSYNEDLQDFYNLADLIICRAGAGTLFEVQFFKKNCITIPLETNINNHQISNAYAIAHMNPNQFTVLRQKECENLLPTIMLQKLL